MERAPARRERSVEFGHRRGERAVGDVHEAVEQLERGVEEQDPRHGRHRREPGRGGEQPDQGDRQQRADADDPRPQAAVLRLPAADGVAGDEIGHARPHLRHAVDRARDPRGDPGDARHVDHEVQGRHLEGDVVGDVAHRAAEDPPPGQDVGGARCGCALARHVGFLPSGHRAAGGDRSSDMPRCCAPASGAVPGGDRALCRRPNLPQRLSDDESRRYPCPRPPGGWSVTPLGDDARRSGRQGGRDAASRPDDRAPPIRRRGGICAGSAP